MRIRSLLACVVTLAVMSTAYGDTVTSFDADWRFTTGDPTGAQEPQFNGSSWQVVDLPHDWSIAGPIARTNPTSRAGGYFPVGVGWYRKIFTLPPEAAGQRVTVRFDGVYMLSEVWINGTSLGVWPYGYSSFAYDITPQLKEGQPNTIAVRVDNSKQINSRWYTGSGIYRHVTLELRDPVHIVPESVFISTASANRSTATLKIAMSAQGQSGGNASGVNFTTEVFALDREGNRTGDAVAKAGPVEGQFVDKEGMRIATADFTAQVSQPRLWSPESPSRYVAVTTLSRGDRVVDTVETPIGIRTIEVSADKGFLLNGEPVLLYGGCIHHDLGPLGAAAFDRAEERRVEILKAAGFNALRTAHNPPSKAFLDACDRLGMLVMDEAFDTWQQPKNREDYSQYFNEWWRRDVDALVLRDRNHPSVIFWSIGNEIPDLGHARGLADGMKLIERVKQLDPTRFVTDAVQLYPGMAPRDYNWSWNDADPLLAHLDVVGYNYQMGKYNQDHERVPERVIVGTESYPRDMFASWQWAAEHTWVLGDFVWTAWDYFGESGLGRVSRPGTRGGGGGGNAFPYHGAFCGDIDICGFRKPVSYARNITWDRGEKLYVSVIELGPDDQPLRAPGWGTTPSRASWTWPGQEGKPLDVQVYSRYDAVRMSLNGNVIGEKPTGKNEQFKAVFSVPYEPGTLKTEALVDGKVVATDEIKTVGPADKLRLSVDRDVIHANGQDLSYVTIESLDSDGNFQPNGDQEIRFEVTGAGVLAAVANGDLDNTDDYVANTRKLFQGKALAIIRSTHQAGPIEIRATASNLRAASARIESR